MTHQGRVPRSLARYAVGRVLVELATLALIDPSASDRLLTRSGTQGPTPGRSGASPSAARLAVDSCSAVPEGASELVSTHLRPATEVAALRLLVELLPRLGLC